MPDMKAIVNERKEQERAREREKNRRRDLKIDLLEVLKSPSGRRVFKYILKQPRTLDHVTDPYHDAFSLGRLSAVQEIRDMFSAEQLRQIEDEND